MDETTQQQALRRAVSQPGSMMRVIRSSLLRTWLVGVKSGEIEPGQEGPEILKEANELAKHITKEVREEIARIDSGDPDRIYKAYKAKQEVILAQRKTLDIQKGGLQRRSGKLKLKR